MDRDYMMRLINERITILEKRYKAACSGKTEDGETLTYGNAAAIRTQCKRDLQLLKLMIALIAETKRDMFISNEDIINSFHRLVEPNERFRKQRG